MKKIKTISIFLILINFSNELYSQTSNKDVIITSTGSGKTLEDAKQAALRSATEQAFGAFVSSKTEMFNDQIVADQMASVSSGNIKSFEILNETQFPDMRWGVTLKVMVSVDKLTSFVAAKGIEIEVKGGLFALNIKQQSLNELGEIKAIGDMVGLLHEPMQISFDYEIESSDPKSLDSENKNWEIPLVVTATTNMNMDFCAGYIIKTLEALGLSTEEVISYKNLDKAIFPIIINYNGVDKTYYLRKQSSINTLKTLLSQWNFYTLSFTVQSGLDEKNGNDVYNDSRYENKTQIHKLTDKELTGFDPSLSYEPIKINLLNTGKKAAVYAWKDKRTLTEIEKMTGYNVTPRGISSQFKHGGFVVYESTFYSLDVARTALSKNAAKKGNEFIIPSQGGIAEKAGLKLYDKIIAINNIEAVNANWSELINKSEDKYKLSEFTIERNGKILTFQIYPVQYSSGGLVLDISDLGNMVWGSAKAVTDELVSNGYSDWRLPTKAELKAIYDNLKRYGIGNFENEYYWSSKNGEIGGAWDEDFDNNKRYGCCFYTNEGTYGVRAVRTF
jgi:hypothetical protein